MSVLKISGNRFLPSLLSRHSSSFILRTPPKSAPREVPTPLVFLSASQWDPLSSKGMQGFAAMFAEKGFTCLETDLSSSELQISSEAMMSHFESELKHNIRICSIPFAPVIFARSAGALIAQTYISSNPASGLFLISPPSSNEAVSQTLLPTPLTEFNYEPKFPLAVMGPPKEVETFKRQSRLGKDEGVDMITVNDLDDQEAFVKMEQWLDDIGV